MICPKCMNECDERYRNKPKGELAEFVCMDCLPENMRPDEKMIEDMKQFSQVLKQGGKNETI